MADIDNLKGGTKRVVEETEPLNNLRGGTKRVVIVGGGGGSSLPDQTGQSGKFLTTDGTDASWSDKAVVNNATGNYSIAIGGGSVCEANNSVAVGERTRSVGSYNVAIGSQAANSSSSGQAGQMQIAIGYFAKTRAYGAIQLGMGQNRDANTFKVGNDNGNFEIMSADGTIPADRLVHAINWYSTMPTASADNLDDIIQFTGATDANYTNGYFYKCVVASTTPASATIAQTTGSTLSDLTVDATTFWGTLGYYSIPQQTGDYVFTYNDGMGLWDYEDRGSFDLAEFGVAYTGTPADGDVLTISVTAPSATYAWTRVDVQPNTGTLTPDFNSVKFNGLSTLQSRDYYMDVSGQYYLRIGAGASLSGDDLLIRTGSSAQRSIAFGSGHGGAIGSASSKFGRVYTQKINNGADIAVPTTGGTMAVIGVNTTATLAVADWSSNTQTVSVTGMTADGVVFVNPTPANQSAYTSAGILCTAQAAGSLTFTCDTVPSADITVTVVML